MSIIDSGGILMKLAQPRHEKLLNWLLQNEHFGYEDLAVATERSEGALRVQFHRWENAGLRLLLEHGTVEDNRRERKRNLFVLNEGFRETIQSALDKIRANQAHLPIRDTLPEIEATSVLLRDKLDDEERDLSECYYIAVGALRRLNAVESYLSNSSEKLGFQPSDQLRTRLSRLRGVAEFGAESTLKHIRKKISEVKDKVERVGEYADVAEKDGPDSMEGYFVEMPERSVSGFGGALIARGERRAREVLDDFWGRNFTGTHPHSQLLGGRLRNGLVHVVSESLELERIEPTWSELVDQIWSGVNSSPPVSDLHEMSRVRRLIDRRNNPDAFGEEDVPAHSAPAETVELADGGPAMIRQEMEQAEGAIYDVSLVCDRADMEQHFTQWEAALPHEEFELVQI